MGRVNLGRLVAGGALAGVVLNICDYVSNNWILAADWDHIARIHNLDMTAMASAAALVTYVVVDMLLGWLIVWTYVAIRPRVGSGSGTAVIAGFMVFVAQALLLSTYAVSLLSWDVVTRFGLLMLVSAIAAALAGFWVYGQETVID